MSDSLATAHVPARPQGGGPVLRAERVGLTRNGRKILNEATVEVASGELVGLIGPSGSGKTSLLRAMAGVAEPTEGRVTLGGDPILKRQIEVGYLPYIDCVHDRLTVREELHFAGNLRLPEVAPDEIESRIAEVIGLLRLDDRADALIGSLSGGERRRAACAVELLANPTMLLLDEPATGLDPVLERRLMETLRSVADQSRGVLVATHATSSLALCDSVAVMATGGRLAFQGSPAAALEFFGATSYDEIYDALGPGEEHPPDEAGRAPQATRQRSERVVGPFLPQVQILSHRYWLTFSRDRRTLALLVGQAPIMGLIIGMVLPRNVLSDNNLGPFYSMLLIFLLLTASIWLGIISGCREIVKERVTTAREVAAGVRFDAYLLSKLVVLCPLVALQVGAVLLVALVVQPLDASAGVHLEVFGLCVLGGWAALTLGLLTSALSRSVDQATAVVPLLLIPQLLFAGAIIPTTAMPKVVELLSGATFSRWGLVGLGDALGIGDDLENTLGSVTGFSSNFFALGVPGAALVLVAFCGMTLVATAITLDRRLRR